MDFIHHSSQILIGTGYIVLYLIIFFFAKWLKGLFSSYNLDEQLTQYDNNAVSVSVAGYFIGVTLIYISAISGDTGQHPGIDFLIALGYCAGGILLLLLSRFINQKLILYRFSLDKEIINDQNPGTGAVEAATYIASGMIIAGSIFGEGGGPLVTLVFYAIGQLCLVLFAQIYVRLTPYSVHEEIEKDNIAAGLSFAGGIISIGIIVMHAVSGTFVSWGADLLSLGKDVLIVFVYLLVIRVIFDRFVLRNSNLVTEISKDQNIGAGLLEMVVAICFSAVLYFVI